MQRPDDGDGGRAFAQIAPPPAPGHEAWTAIERAAYAPGPTRRPCRVPLDPATERAAPALARETLLALWAEAPDDEEVRRAIWRQRSGLSAED